MRVVCNSLDAGSGTCADNLSQITFTVCMANEFDESYLSCKLVIVSLEAACKGLERTSKPSRSM